jgi:S-adenosylmethionine hydrolase
LEHPIFIHLLADFDNRSPENSIYTAILHKNFPQARIVISNQDFKKGDMMAPGIFLKLILSHFPENTFHLCPLHIESRLPEKYVMALSHGQYFLGPDNGFLPIAFGDNESTYYKLSDPERGNDVMKHTFVPTVQKMVNGQFNDSSLAVEDKPRKYLLPAPTVSGNIWRLMVLYNDSQGNAYLNMDKAEFDRITEGKKFRIRLSHKDNIENIAISYHDVQEGNKLAIFGLGDMLQIAINCGSAEQYLGLRHGSMVMMEIL